jgi:hypothetical protein
MGSFSFPARRGGDLILVEALKREPTGTVPVYVRASSADQSPEPGSSGNKGGGLGQRPGFDCRPGGDGGRVSTKRRRGRFLARVQDPKVQTIGVERRDRVARFGVEEVRAALAA